MIDHASALRLSAIRLDFPLVDDEQPDLDAHLASCVDCRSGAVQLRADAARLEGLDFGPVATSVRADLAIAAERRPDRSSVGRWFLFAAAALLIVAAVGGVASGVGVPRDGDRVGGPLGGRAVHWTTPVVDLQVADFFLEAGGRRFVPPPDANVRVHSDPGDATYWTFEATWFEGAIEMRMNLYFGADASRWRIDSARIYNGRPQGEWLEVRSDVAGAPLGTPFTGDLDIRLTDLEGHGAGPGRIVMRDARIATNPGDRAPVPNGVNGEPLPSVPGAGTDPWPIGEGPVLMPLDGPAAGVRIACGPMSAGDCQAFIPRAMAAIGTSHPGQRVDSIAVLSTDGSYQVVFTDGTSDSATVD